MICSFHFGKALAECQFGLVDLFFGHSDSDVRGGAVGGQNRLGRSSHGFFVAAKSIPDTRLNFVFLVKVLDFDAFKAASLEVFLFLLLLFRVTQLPENHI